jgi:hypothetical protein
MENHGVLFNRTDGTQIFGNDQDRNPRTRYQSRRLQRDCMRTLVGMGEEIVWLKHAPTGALIATVTDHEKPGN